MLLRLVFILSLALKQVHAISSSAVALNQSAASVQAASTDNGGLVRTIRSRFFLFASKMEPRSILLDQKFYSLPHDCATT